MVKVEKEFCFSFVYTPKKPSCLMADGTCDYDKYQALLAAAKQGDNDAQVKIFEQHQGMMSGMKMVIYSTIYRMIPRMIIFLIIIQRLRHY